MSCLGTISRSWNSLHSWPLQSDFWVTAVTGATGASCLVSAAVTAGAPGMLLLFFSSIWHTELITGTRDAPPHSPHTHTHTRSSLCGDHSSPSSPWLPQDKLLQYNRAVYACAILSLSLGWNRSPCRLFGKASDAGCAFFAINLGLPLLFSRRVPAAGRSSSRQ